MSAPKNVLTTIDQNDHRIQELRGKDKQETAQGTYINDMYIELRPMTALRTATTTIFEAFFHDPHRGQPVLIGYAIRYWPKFTAGYKTVWHVYQAMDGEAIGCSKVKKTAIKILLDRYLNERKQEVA